MKSNNSSFAVQDRTARDLGWRKLEQILHDLCRSPFGVEALSQSPFPRTLGAIESRMDAVLESTPFAEMNVVPDFGGVRDVRIYLERIQKEGSLTPQEITDVAKTLEVIARIRALICSREEEMPLAADLAEPLQEDRSFSKRVAATFDDEGRFCDDASPLLAQLREKVRELRGDAKHQLDGLVRKFDDDGVLQDRNFTVRNDRYVLPVRSEFQRKVEGIVHDASRTGQTVFVEPRSLMQLGNRIKIALSECAEEEDRILHVLSSEISQRANSIRSDLSRIGQLEALFVRALVCARMIGKKPRFSSGKSAGGRMSLRNARHPLLAYEAGLARREGKKLPGPVPSHLAFGEKQALIISGPNAGGKTVALKTMGLIAVMVRAGMPVPIDDDSVVPFFDSVLITLGDEQNLDRALSSFSGHLEALNGIFSTLNLDEQRRQERGAGSSFEAGALVLLDELLSGTDPSQGAALAQAVLEDLTAHDDVQVVATTHYERLKTLAVLEAGDETAATVFRNASVALDSAGRPTFEVRLDEVGTSNALHAARRHLLPESIITRAEALIDPAEKDLHSVLTKLSSQSAALDEERRQAEVVRKEAENVKHQLERRLLEVRQEKDRLRREGTKAIIGDLQEARRQVAAAIEKIRGADAKSLNEVSHQLRNQEQELRVKAAPEKVVFTTSKPSSIKVGDTVESANMVGTLLEVLEIHGDEVVAGKGVMRMRLPTSDLRVRHAAPQSGTQKNSKKRKKSKSQLDSMKTSTTTLDLRGVRVEQGLELLEAFLDRLLGMGENKAWVLHGHGTGVMKRAVRDFLKESPYASRHRVADDEDGGDAFTEVELAESPDAR
ncbi:MAG: hypothetical protein GY822_30880 [Deltaproteobacteria bacterium]|nr:hypothetical protein [Deltaproteobacteria bacterium]